jgi:hypothetical protein
MLPLAVHLDPIPGTCSSLGQQELDALLGCDQRPGDRCHLPSLHSRPSRPWSVSLPPEARFVSPGQPRRPLPAGRQTRTSLPRNLDAGLASALPRSLVRCLRAASSSWTPLRPLSATGLPGAAFSCSHLASPHAHLPGAPAPSEPRWTLPGVKVDWSPLAAPGRCTAAPPGQPWSL